MNILSRFRYPVGFVVGFLVASLVGSGLPLALGWGLIVITLGSGVAAGVLVVKLLTPDDS